MLFHKADKQNGMEVYFLTILLYIVISVIKMMMMLMMINNVTPVIMDDYRLKGLPMSNRTCINCDMYCIESVIHILTQCPFYQEDRNEMYKEIFVKC